ncbi:oxygenase MpaB family protein [Kluyvera sp. CHPC 1.251]|uniref:oxygenase MpaB family protein n=1 Tax=Kluyvera sp. CHPC 1.251 TaxID=2995175 RepID=UPI002FD7CE81
MEWVRQRIERQVLGLTGIALNEIDFEHPAGEPGLFGPQSAIWPVHGDFTSMLCGGISALLLQMLHPLALAGVWDHSSFREDIFGRLRRTSQFISATTFATEPDAERLIARVKAIHDRVSGVDIDGTPYAASDPDLLTWVHVAECSSFMASHLRYRRVVVSPARQAQYFIESASIAERLGARNVPKTPQVVADYLEQMRPQLRCDERTREVARVLMTTRLPGRMAQPAGTILMKAGIDLLPDWAQEMLDLRLSPLEQRLVRGGVHTIAAVLRRSVRNGAYHCAMRRMSSSA